MPPASSSSSALCTSEGCKALETSLRENIDTSIDPCEDFLDTFAMDGYNGILSPTTAPHMDNLAIYRSGIKQHIHLLVDKLSPDSEKLAAARCSKNERCLPQ